MQGIARLYDRLNEGLAISAAALIALMGLGISVDVVLRNAGLGVISWMLEAAEYGLFLSTFLGAPWVLKEGGHVRVDVLVNSVPPWLGRWLEGLADLFGLGVSAVLFYYSAAVALDSQSEGARIIKEFIFPEWWVFAIVCFSAALLMVEFLCRLWRLRAPPEGA